MKKLFQYLIFCMFALLVTDRGLSFILDYLYVKTKTGQTGGKINYYLTSTKHVDFLIMGNSRSLYQIIPDSLAGNAYNLSHAGMGPSFQTGLLSVLIKQAKLPSIILLHIEPYDFIGDHENRDIQNLRYYYGKDSIVTQLINKISTTEKFKFTFQLYRYNGKGFSLLKNFVQTSSSAIDSNGYEPLPPQPTDSINTLYSVQAHEPIPAASLNPEQAEILSDFIQMCRVKNIKLICFTSPVYYESDSNFTVALDSLGAFLAKMNVPYLNYIKSPIESLENHPSLWRDANHLNHKGAQIESQRLKKDLTGLLEQE
ncbi:MAG: hypothetical protein R2820_08790 [Cyclobacteriaceae bacterium]|nr:hypothetical protein [Cyclobacteriaceae bacterium]